MLNMILDKLSRPVRNLRISVTDRCNFRCLYCMPADVVGREYVFLAREQILSFEEIVRLVKIFVQLGVTKVRLTGGEPLLRKDLEVLVEMLSEIRDIKDLALTTNGYLLQQKARSLKEAGLKRLTVSLDTLDPEVFRKLAGRKAELEQVLDGISTAAEVGFAPVKINAVIQKGVNEQEVLNLAKYAKMHGYIIRFIEYMDVGNLNDWRMDQVVSAKEIVGTIAAEMPLEPIAKQYKSEVANRYRYLDGEGEIGVIASVTQPFCGDCTRARLSADGKIYTCLFASQGHDIKKLLRDGASDRKLQQVLSSIWASRTDRYSEERTSNTTIQSHKKVEMYEIGG
ncbi:MAG: GTP 3',8-cyclase MoaA [bacterium]